MGVTDIAFIIFSLNQIKDFEYQTVSYDSLVWTHTHKGM